MKRRSPVKALKSLLVFEEATLTDVARRQVEASVEQFNEKIAAFAMLTFFFYLLVFMIVLQEFVAPQLLATFYAAHSLFILIIGVVVALRFVFLKPAAKIVFIVEAFGTVPTVVLGHLNLKLAESAQAQWLSLIHITTLAGLIVIFCPNHARAWRVAAGALFVALAVAIGTSGMPSLGLIVFSILFLLFAMAKALIAALAWSEAVKELQIAESSRMVERRKIEHELDLARRIQDSLVAPSCVEIDGVRITTYQSKHELVGGDWCAIRVMPSGEIFVVVADAAGKGIQAALVIHAVQSLWADSLEDRLFDPALWIKRVNHALLRLGERAPHAITLGILTLHGSRVSYWSAGHTPLYLMDRRQEKAIISSHVGYGSMLGLGDEMTLRPVILDLSDKVPCDLLVGTDGVFDQGARIMRKNLTLLVDEVARIGDQALDICKTEDDKTLIWVRVLHCPQLKLAAQQ